MISLGLAGYGRFGRILERAASAIGAPIVAVFDPSLQGFDARSELGAVATRTLADLVAHPEVEAIIIASSHSTHRSVAEAAFAAGKHVFCEKPLATTVVDAEAIARASIQADRVLMVGHVMRLHPLAIAVKDEIAAGVVGAPAIATATRTDFLPRRGWWAAGEQVGGLSFSPGIHTLDLLNWWLGSPRDVVAYPARQTQGGLDYPDAAIAIIRYISGAIAQVGLSLSSSYPEGRGTNEITLTCQRGTIHVDFAANPRMIVEFQAAVGSIHAGNSREATVDDDLLLVSELQRFVDVVERRAEPMVSASDAIMAIATCQAIERSMAAGSAVTISSLIGARP